MILRFTVVKRIALFALLCVCICAESSGNKYLYNSDAKPIRYSGTEASGGSIDDNTPVSLYNDIETSVPMPFEKLIANRTIIDDLSYPDSWTGTHITAQASSAITITSNGEAADVSKAFESYMPLQTYLCLAISTSDVQNIEWATVYLLGDLSYTSYYECDLVPFLTKGLNFTVLNKSDFAIGAGAPQWDKISAIKIEFGSLENASSGITLQEVSTYDAYPMCSLWFDDGWKSVYTEAFPIMEEKGFDGILSVIGSHVNYPLYCSDAELDEMYADGWDFVNHTYRHLDLTSVTPDEAEADIYAGYCYLYSHGYTRACANMVPPYCATNPTVDAIISKYAMTSRVNSNRFNDLPLQDPYDIVFREVKSDTSPSDIRQWIDHAIEYNLWLVLVFHSIESPSDVYTKYDVQNFQTIVDYLYQKKSAIDVVTLSQLLHQEQVLKNAPVETAAEKTIPAAEPGNAGWILAWEDDFTGTQLNEGDWNVLDQKPLANKELQTYRPQNVKLQSGCLQIFSSKEEGAYYSGAVTTQGKRTFLNGRIDIRAKLPGGQGIFPAFWMLPEKGAGLPEIDIMECLGNDPTCIWHVFHYMGAQGQGRYYANFKGANFSDDFHVFTLQWTKKRLIWMIDGVQTFAVDNYIPDKSMFLYLNTAVGGSWPGSPDKSTIFPQSMLIDYVKYYIADL